MYEDNTPQKHTEVEAERNLTVNTSPAVTGCTGGNATGSNDSYTSNNSNDEHLVSIRFSWYGTSFAVSANDTSCVMTHSNPITSVVMTHSKPITTDNSSLS